ncbi:MAG: glycosyltransferase [Candidatus Methanoperedens sp.]|nr:glycosyltransferase [Candidatus Methanoperedens sp.]
MRLLLVPLAGGVGLGPLTRCLAVAHEAKIRGHEVLFLCKDTFCEIVRKFGYRTYTAPTSVRNQGQKLPPFRLSDVAITLGWVEESYINSAIEAERQTIRSFRPDVIFTETQFSLPLSASIENIPWVAATSWADHPDFKSPLYKDNETASGFEERFNHILDKYSQPKINDICELAFLRAQIKIAPTTPELQPELQDIPDVHYVGSLLSPEMEDSFLTPQPERWLNSKLPDVVENWEQNHPVIYVYMSPGDIKPNLWIPTLIKAFKDTRFNVIVTLAPLKILPNSLPNISNIKFFESLPAIKAIRRSNLVITHGGANTVTSALISGKPMMIFPDKYAERDYNGRAVERLGAGMNFRTEKFTPQDLLLNAEKITSDSTFALNAKKIGDRIRKLGGSRSTFDLIEKIV